MAGKFIEEFLYRGKADGTAAWSVTLAVQVKDGHGGAMVSLDGPMGPEAAEAKGFPLSTVLEAINAAGLKTADQLKVELEAEKVAHWATRDEAAAAKEEATALASQLEERAAQFQERALAYESHLADLGAQLGAARAEAERLAGEIEGARSAARTEAMDALRQDLAAHAAEAVAAVLAQRPTPAPADQDGPAAPAETAEA